MPSWAGPTPRLWVSSPELVPIKGHASLLEAFAQLRGAWPNLRGLLVGDGPERERLTELATALGITGIIHFAGYRSDVGSLYRECDIVCLPSEIEGLPFAALEAASFGIPLVATAVGDVPEYFEHGTSARLAPARDVAALAAELERRLANPRQARLDGRGGAGHAAPSSLAGADANRDAGGL